MRKFKRISAILMVLVLTLCIASPALAADDNPALIDPSKLGSITIYKFDDSGKSEAADKVGNGIEISDPSGLGNPLGGVSFTITFLPTATGNTSVTQAQGFIDSMTEAELLENQRTGMTGVGGKLLFANLKQGIYLVEEVENTATEGVVSPFLVSIPMTDPTNQSNWLYDIYVYPKNTLAKGTIDKKVLDKSGKQQSSTSASIGEKVEWLISVTIPGAVAGIDPTNPDAGYFYITDSLDSRLNYKGVKVEIVSKDGTKRELLVEGTHYILTAPNEGAPGTGEDDIIVDFKTADGIEKFMNTNVDSRVEITVTTVINETAVTNLALPITNSAKMYFNNEDGDPSDPTNPSVPDGPAPEVYPLGIAIRKVDEKAELLDDAIFTIYKTTNDAQAGTAIQLNSADWTETSGASLAVVGSTPATYLKGYIYFSGEVLDELGLPSAVGTEYCFVETTAPSGYDLLDTVHVLKCGTTTTIANQKSPTFLLPITGGSGTLLLTIIGIALIGGAVAILFAARKRKKANGIN